MKPSEIALGVLLVAFIVFGLGALIIPKPQESTAEPKQVALQVPAIDPNSIVTRAGSLLCVEPYSFREAWQAIGQNDTKWLHTLGCVNAVAGIPVTLIETSSIKHPSIEWKVRVRTPATDGMTLYGLQSGFQTADGRSLSHDGTPMAKRR
jgi:hypothetical protein